MANTAKVTREVRPKHLTDTKHANHLIRKCGGIVVPRGHEYLGSAVVHYYRKPQKVSPLAIEQTNEYSVVCQVLVSDVEEGLADIGHKELKTQLMAAYGRKPPASTLPSGIILT